MKDNLINGSRRPTAADIKYMSRALQLARFGAGHASPNPMVGAVLVANGNIIGEGWHRKCGCPHAEVNAIASVKAEHKHLIAQSTLYVTLEPCSHYGKTPPCAKLIIEKNIPEVVVATNDPFPAVAGRGIQMLRQAGVNVIENVLQKEAINLNKRFFTAHILHRPFILLKWAQSGNEQIATTDISGNHHPIAISTPLSTIFMHRQRAMSDAILVGTNTIISDNPSLTCRLHPGDDPTPVIFDSSRLPHSAKIVNKNHILLNGDKSLKENMEYLYSEHGITSLLVEGGANTLQSFIDADLFDEIRIETAPGLIIDNGLKAPELPAATPKDISTIQIDDNQISTLSYLRI